MIKIIIIIKIIIMIVMNLLNTHYFKFQSSAISQFT